MGLNLSIDTDGTRLIGIDVFNFCTDQTQHGQNSIPQILPKKQFKLKYQRCSELAGRIRPAWASFTYEEVDNTLARLEAEDQLTVPTSTFLKTFSDHQDLQILYPFQSWYTNTRKRFCTTSTTL